MAGLMAPVQVRVARATADLDRAVAFYVEALELPLLGGFDGHAGYDGRFVGLPGAGVHLELTAAVDATPTRAPDPDDLLVLYLDGPDRVSEAAARLATLGIEPVPHANPYWAGVGAVHVRDPDGWGVVLVPSPGLAAGGSAGLEER